MGNYVETSPLHQQWDRECNRFDFASTETSLFRVFLVSMGCFPAVISICSMACHLLLNPEFVLRLRYSQPEV
jgi:hypothetical protein